MEWWRNGTQKTNSHSGSNSIPSSFWDLIGPGVYWGTRLTSWRGNGQEFHQQTTAYDPSTVDLFLGSRLLIGSGKTWVSGSRTGDSMSSQPAVLLPVTHPQSRDESLFLSSSFLGSWLSSRDSRQETADRISIPGVVLESTSKRQLSKG